MFRTLLGSHMRWMSLKDMLKQDMLLLGAPGPIRRRIALNYCQSQGRSWEYVSLTRDVTESDLKQRREIYNRKDAIWTNQPVVRAALSGSILILEGLENAERNVLPILNNLLENREMHLENGEHIISFEKYTMLREKYSEKELAMEGLKYAHPDFRVVATCVPVPPFSGLSMDPPLRSRFQARYIEDASLPEMLDAFGNSNSNKMTITTVPPTLPLALQAVDAYRRAQPPLQRGQYHALLSDAQVDVALKILTAHPKEETIASVIPRVLPALPGQQIFSRILSEFQGMPKHSSQQLQQETNMLGGNASASASATASASASANTYGTVRAQALRDLQLGLHICLMGGAGKSFLASELPQLLGGTSAMIVPLFRDMSSRDLLATRVTSVDGNTDWVHSPIIQAAIEGKVVILEGIEELYRDSLSVLHPLLQDGFIALPSGQVLRAGDIHPAFRVIATVHSSDDAWLTDDLAHLFTFHRLPLKLPLSSVCGASPAVAAVESAAESIAKLGEDFVPISLKNQLRLVEHLERFPHDIHERLFHTMLVPFLPKSTKERLREAIPHLFESVEASGTLSVQLSETTLQIGEISLPVQDGGMRVPYSAVFHENQEHLRILQAMMKTFGLLSQNLLLIGPQGVGKNKLVDRLLSWLNIPAFYIQLHRDSSVQSLTVQPVLRDGILQHEPSALMRACMEGLVCVVDELDKAPIEVIQILKHLVEGKEMTLFNGTAVKPHPEFRVIGLANRPGFPFLGNNFFRVIGDSFSIHTIDNPSLTSTLELVRPYTSALPLGVVEVMCRIFHDLQELCLDGSLKYPYSTRELVSVLKHMQAYPQESAAAAMDNVFAFDKHDPVSSAFLESVVRRHGMPTLAATHQSSHIHMRDITANTVPLSYQVASASDPIACIGDFHPHQEKLTAWQFATRAWESTGILSDREKVFSEVKYSLPGAFQHVTVLPSNDLVVSSARQVSLLRAQDMFATSLSFDLRDIFHYNADKVSSVQVAYSGLPNSVFGLVDGKIGRVLLWMDFGEKVVKNMSHILKHFAGSKGIFGGSSMTELQFAASSSHGTCLFAVGSNVVAVLKDRETSSSLYRLPFPVKNIFYLDQPGLYIVQEASSNRLHLIDKQWTASKALQLQNETGSMLWAASHGQNSVMCTDNGSIIRFPSNFIGKNLANLLQVVETPLSAAVSMGDSFLFQRQSDNGVTLINCRDAWMDDLNKETVSAAFISVLPGLNLFVVLSPEGHLKLLSNPLSLLDEQSIWERLRGGVQGEEGGREGGNVSGSPAPTKGPKEGQVDPFNAPHVGGNTWKGGSGGSDTAGLGGRGGPYRLDSGHDVHQISDAMKEELSEEAREVVRRVNRDLFQKRLEEIGLTSAEADIYHQLSSSFHREIVQIQSLVDSLHARKHERGWVRHQSSGEWDDMKLVEGLIGDRNVFKKRQDIVPPEGLLTSPKKMTMLWDVSASMYRLNSFDGRLDRMKEAAIMLMEGLGNSDVVEYAFRGHSGDSAFIPLVEFGKPPSNVVERLRVIDTMEAHTQYCMSGDNTVDSLGQCIEELVKFTESDERVLVCLSDANFDRYQISPELISRMISKEEDVQVFMILIGTIGNSASLLSSRLPKGRVFMCMNNAELPRILEELFENTVLATSE